MEVHKAYTQQNQVGKTNTKSSRLFRCRITEISWDYQNTDNGNVIATNTEYSRLLNSKEIAIHVLGEKLM